jgi:DnaJ-class molecular chaperone
MNGTVDVTCTSCHGHPPVEPHVVREDCGTCHGAAYATGVDPVLHQNGRVDPRHSDTYGDVCPGVDATPACVQCHPCVK